MAGSEMQGNEPRESFSRMVLQAKLNELRKKEMEYRMEWEQNIRHSIANHWYLSTISVTFLSIFDFASRLVKSESFDPKAFPFGDVSKMIEMQRAQFSNSFRYSSAEGGLFSRIDQINAGLRNQFNDLVVGLKESSGDIQAEIDHRVQFYARIRKELDLLSDSNMKAAGFLNQLSGQFQLPANAFIGLARMMGTDADELSESPLMKNLSDTLGLIARLTEDYKKFTELEAADQPAQLRFFDPQDLFNDLLGEYLEKAFDEGVEVFFNISSQIPAQLIGDIALLRRLVSTLFEASIASCKPSSGFEGPARVRFVVEVQEQDQEVLLYVKMSELQHPDFVRFLNQLKGQPGDALFGTSNTSLLLLSIHSLTTRAGGAFLGRDEEGRGCSVGFSFTFANGNILE